MWAIQAVELSPEKLGTFKGMESSWVMSSLHRQLGIPLLQKIKAYWRRW